MKYSLIVWTWALSIATQVAICYTPSTHERGEGLFMEELEAKRLFYAPAGSRGPSAEAPLMGETLSAKIIKASI